MFSLYLNMLLLNKQNEKIGKEVQTWGQNSDSKVRMVWAHDEKVWGKAYQETMIKQRAEDDSC